MDPVSLVVASASAGKICVSLGWSLKKFMDGAKIADKRIESLIHDIKSFGKILDVLQETVHDSKVQSWAGLGGNVGSYWEELLICLQDSEKTLASLEQTVGRIDKSAQILDSSRKELRLQAAADEIGMYQSKCHPRRARSRFSWTLLSCKNTHLPIDLILKSDMDASSCRKGCCKHALASIG